MLTVNNLEHPCCANTARSKNVLDDVWSR